MAGTFWKDTTDFLLDGLGTNLFAQSANLISNIAPLFSMGFGIYFMIIILNAYGRGFDGNAIDFAKKTVAWLIIIACAFNATQYQKIAGMLYEFPEWLAGIINGNFDVGAIDVAWDSITQAVSQITEQASDLGMTDFADKLMFYIAAGLLICCGIVFFGIVVAYYLVAKISLAMVLLIGPLFLGMMLFSSTRQYAMNWFSQIFNYAVTIALFTILMSVQMKIFENHIQNLVTEHWASSLQIFGILPVFLLVTILLVVVAFSIPSIASALTGGAGAGGFSTMVNFVRQALNGGKHSSPLSGVGVQKAYGQGKTAIGKARQFMGYMGNHIGNGRK